MRFDRRSSGALRLNVCALRRPRPCQHSGYRAGVRLACLLGEGRQQGCQCRGCYKRKSHCNDSSRPQCFASDPSAKTIITTSKGPSAVGALLLRVGGVGRSGTTRSRTGAVGLDETEPRTGASGLRGWRRSGNGVNRREDGMRRQNQGVNAISPKQQSPCAHDRPRWHWLQGRTRLRRCRNSGCPCGLAPCAATTHWASMAQGGKGKVICANAVVRARVTGRKKISLPQIS